MAGGVQARLRHDVRAGAPAARPWRALADKQTVQNWIADSAAEMHAARLMTLHAAWVMDTRGTAAARREIALIKYYGASVLHDVIDRALQVHGALGYPRTSRSSRCIAMRAGRESMTDPMRSTG